MTMKKSMTMKRKQIQIPIFNVSLQLFVGKLDTVITYLSATYHENLWHCRQDWDIDGCCFTNLPDGSIALWMHPDCDWTVLAHETGHATFYIIKQLGMSVEDEELFCYLHQHLNEQCKCILHEPTELTDPPPTQEDTLPS